MRLRTWFVAAAAIIATALLAGRAISMLVVEHAWYASMGAPRIFWEQVLDTVLLQGGAWVLGSLFAFANLHAVRRTILAVAVPSRVANIELTEMLSPRRLLTITIVMAAMIGLAMALPLTDWTQVALARHGTPFVEREGILDRDFGFYVYQLPLEETAYLWALGVLVVTVTVTLLLYALTRSLRMDGRRIIASNHVRRHLSVLGTIVLVLLAWSYRLDTFDVLQRGSGPEGLFMRIDHVVTLPIDRILVIVCLVAAPILLRAGWMGQVRLALVTLTVVLAGALGGRQLLPVLLARSAVVGDPAKRDRPYVATRTLVSRRAYDVDAVVIGGTADSSRVAARTRLTLSDLASNVSMWEPEATRLRVSEARATLLDASAAGWTRDGNQHLAALLVRRPVAEGDRWSVAVADVTQPLLRDSVLDVAIGARGESDEGDTPIAAPGVQGHALVSDPAGVLGPALRGFGMRVAHAWALRDPSLLSADTVSGPAPRLVSYRDVRTRVARLAPVFAQGEVVQPLLQDGAIYWALNLYSASDHYPLSQHWKIGGAERSYFRFAATAIVDAATGRVRFVPAERLDPMARTWLDRVPSLVVRARDLPAELADALPAATESAFAQARTFARYGSRLEGAVLRHLPDSVTVSAAAPTHFVVRSASVEPAWSVALLDNTDHIDGFLTAVGGRSRTTVWDSTTLPRVKWSTASEQLRAALDSARVGVPEGSRREPRVRVSRAQLLPSDAGPVLVQTLVWNRADGAPVITKVGVYRGGRVALGFSLSDAMAGWRGAPSASPAPPEWPLLAGSERDAQLARLYDVMRDAMRRGDWTRFGAAFDSLGLAVGKPTR